MKEEKYVNLNKVYTGRGDKGETDLLGGSKAKKSSLKVEAYGCIDEASSFIGLAKYYCKENKIKQILNEIQQKLLLIGGYLASDDNGKNMLKDKISAQDITSIEKIIDEYNEKLEKIFRFIIPGDTEVGTYFHIARTVVRRAERKIVALSEKEDIDDYIKKYVNRISDLLFVFARYVEEK